MKLLIACCALFSLFFMNHLNADAQKLYCEVEQIELTPTMILIHLGGQTFEIDSLFVDQGGIYFTEDMLRCTYCRRPLNPKNICECPGAGRIDKTYAYSTLHH